MKADTLVDGVIKGLVCLGMGPRTPERTPASGLGERRCPDSASASSFDDSRSDKSSASDRVEEEASTTWSSRAMREIEAAEPLLAENENRFSLFPIQ